MLEPTEKEIQIAFIEYARLKYPRIMIFAIPNDGIMGAKGKTYGLMRRKMGLKKGIPDIFIAHPGRFGKSGMFLELKRRKGVLSQAQKDCIANLEQFYHVRVCYSLDSAIAELDYYLTGNKHNV